MNFKRLSTLVLGAEMSEKLPRLIVTACLLCPTLSWAIGLGEIHLNSALNEPLNAEISLLSATPEELSSLRATLASRELFTRYGIDRPPFLSALNFRVGRGKDGHDALLVGSTDAIPEPFVTFLVEVNWSRGRLIREYTVLLDPPVYTPGEAKNSAAPVAAPVSVAPESEKSGSIQRPAAEAAPPEPAAAAVAPNSTVTPSAPMPGGGTQAMAPAPAPAAFAADGTYRVHSGDTLTKIARGVRGNSAAQLDQVMMALYRSNPEAFDGNINLLRRGAVLQVPGSEQLAAMSQGEAASEIRRQMSAWHGAHPASTEGHLRLVTPPAAAANGTGAGPANADATALTGRVKDLETQLAESRRLLELRSSELAALQQKLAAPPAVATPAPAPAVAPPAPATTPATAAAPATAPAAAAVAPVTAPVPAAVNKVTPAPAAATSWLDWVTENWWLPVAVLVALLAALAFAAWKRRQEYDIAELSSLTATDVADSRDSTATLRGIRTGDESFVVEESGLRERPKIETPREIAEPTVRVEKPKETKTADDTLSSETAINLDQGDPLAEADFHMAYGLYDQAADLVRIALAREPDRRDLKLKLLEIYFVWGNKDAFLQTAKELDASKDRAPAGEWDKIAIMGKQICPNEPLFAKSTGGGMGAGALVDLNLEGGENRVDIDLFGDPDGEKSRLDHSTASTRESPTVAQNAGLDFVLDRPERGEDDSPTREMPPRDEPTVESQAMRYDSGTGSATSLATVIHPEGIRGRIEDKLGNVPGGDQTAELAIDDLGLDLDSLEQTGTPVLDKDAPTMVAGMDERSRKMMEDAESRVRERDLTDLERELEASFIAELDSGSDDVKTAIVGPETARTVMMPKDRSKASDPNATSRIKASGVAPHPDVDSTSELRGIGSDSIDMDLDKLSNAFGAADQPRPAEDVFSSEVFDVTQRNRVDLDVGDPLNGTEGPTTIMDDIARSPTAKLESIEGELPELEPVTMSEVGTKLDLARAYMDMGDPEGARSILEEVAQEGSASQKQEAQRLIESLPG
jgi:pilus assembly protein FimV